jgi:putative ABC transport system permease protein
MTHRSIPYSLAILWRSRSRFLPAVLAVTFSATLITLQCGLLLGLLIFISLPIDHSSADLWVTTGDAPSLTLAQPIPENWLLRVAAQPEVERAEPYLMGYAAWHQPNQGGSENCCIIGSRLDSDSMGVIREATPEMRARLSEPGTVFVDEQDLFKLGLTHGNDEFAEINQRRVRVVGTVRGFKGFTAPFVFCSLQTARMLLPMYEEQPNVVMHVLARCKDPHAAAAVAARLREQYPEMGVYTSADFSLRTRMYWLIRSSAGTVMLCTVSLALLVGLVVTRQTLYAATIASLKEYAVLDALGIPRRRLVMLVLSKSFWIGVFGIAIAMPVIFGLAGAAGLVGTKVLLPVQLLACTTTVTVFMALISGVSALRSLRQLEPASLLR